jgi:Mg2+-importing ATPase
MTEPLDAGLTAAEAVRRLSEYGPNDPTPTPPRSQLTELLMQFANPLIAMLLLASAVSAFVGDIVNATIIVAIVSHSVIVNFVRAFARTGQLIISVPQWLQSPR